MSTVVSSFQTGSESKAFLTKLDLWHLRHWILSVLRPDVGPEMKKLRQANFQLVSTGIAAQDTALCVLRVFSICFEA